MAFTYSQGGRVIEERRHGGLGNKKLQSLRDTLTAKKAYKLINKKDSLWSVVVTNKYNIKCARAREGYSKDEKKLLLGMERYCTRRISCL